MGQHDKGGRLARLFPAAYRGPVRASDYPPPDENTLSVGDEWVAADTLQGPAAGDAVTDRLTAARAARVVPAVTTRDAAIRNSVVNRARDVVCGVLSCLPFTVTRDRGGVVETLPPGWLDRPDPLHSHAWFVANVTDDLFFHGWAAARITVEDDVTGRALALQWMPWDQLAPTDDADVIVWTRGAYPDPFTPQYGLAPIALRPQDVVLWESPLVGVLNGGREVLTTAAQLDRAANRFAGAELAAGWLQQVRGEPVGGGEAQGLVDDWAYARALNAVGFLNESLEYHESEIDPARLQMVESRAYQDGAVARIVNMPAFSLGVGVPNDSMTYKTALTARLDLLDFGLQPFVECWGEALSNEKVTPRGTTVAFDLEPFLRTAQLTPVADSGAETPAPAASTPKV